jgi:hypothetical protein
MRRAPLHPVVGRTIVPAALLLLVVGCRTYSSDPTARLNTYSSAPSAWPKEPPACPIAEATRPFTPAETDVLARAAGTPAAPPLPTDPYVTELLGILKETKSPDAFLMTLGLLVDAKPDHRHVVPAVIRNAERLGLLADHTLQPDDRKLAELSARLTMAIDQLTGRDSGAKCRSHVAPQQPGVEDRCDECMPPSNHRTPVLPPITAGSQILCRQPPSEADVLRAMKRLRVPTDAECADIRIDTELLVDKVDPPRFFPLIGPAQLHHCHWKCTVHITDAVSLAYPLPLRIDLPRVEVVYVDSDHLHLWQQPSPQREVPSARNP